MLSTQEVSDDSAQRYLLEWDHGADNAVVRLLREELQVLQEPGSYVGEVIKVMGKKKVLVKVQPEGKYGRFLSSQSLFICDDD